MIYGYVRAQNEKSKTVQLVFLEGKVDSIIIESTGEALDELLTELKQNDSLYVYDLSRLTRQCSKAKEIIKILLNKNITLYTMDGKASLENLAYTVGMDL